MPELSCIIVNYNSQKYIRDCLVSLFSQNYKDFQVFLIDNASSDSSVALVEKEFPQVQIIKNSSNLGYCKAVNQGILKSHSEYIMPLNFDIILEQDFVQNLISTIKSNREIGSVTGRLLRIKNGQKTNLIDTTGHIILKNRIYKNRGELQKDSGQYMHTEEIWGVCGAAPIYRRQMLEEIKFENEYLDEDFVMGLDDCDLDWRARLLGWKAYYEPKAVAYHVRGGSITKFSFRWMYYHFRNHYLMCTKNETPLNYLWDFPIILIFELGMLLSMLIQFYFIPVGLSYIKLFPRLLKKRAALQKKRKVSEAEIHKWFQ